MHNKKLKGGIAVLALSAVLVGGTFAWLGSTDSLVNKFTSKPSSIPNENNNKGVDIYEVFDTTKANQSVAGTAVNKDVQVKNTADFNSLIRVNFEKIFIDNKDNGILDSVLLDEKNIELNFDRTNDVITLEQLNTYMDSVTEEATTLTDNLKHKWVEVEQTINGKTDTYYYYLGNVEPNGNTKKLLDSVTLSSNVKNDAMYMGRAYNVKVNAYSIQSTAEAVKDSTKGEIYGAYGEQHGFGLSDAQYSKLARALEIVAKSPASSEGLLENATNPEL